PRRRRLEPARARLRVSRRALLGDLRAYPSEACHCRIGERVERPHPTCFVDTPVAHRCCELCLRQELGGDRGDERVLRRKRDGGHQPFCSTASRSAVAPSSASPGAFSAGRSTSKPPPASSGVPSTS